MNPNNKIEKTIINFQPFKIKNEEQFEMSESTICYYQEILNTLSKSQKSTVTVSTNEPNGDKKIEIDINTGIINLIKSSMFLKNLRIVRNSAHGADDTLTEKSQKNTDQFFQELFNLDSNDDENQRFELDEIYIEKKLFSISFITHEQYIIEIELI